MKEAETVMKESVASFLSNVLSVVLGIVITFSIQGMIDRSRDRKEVRSALQLVRTELQANVDDISVMCDYLWQEKASAEYILQHRVENDSCPSDSISYHSGIIFAEASISVSQDALELLKNSSLFQKIGSNDLSMKIIRAYDSCGTIVAALNSHLDTRNSQFEGSVNEETAGKFASTGGIDIRDFIKTDYGLYVIRRLASLYGIESISDTSDITDALDAIDAFLGKRFSL